MDQNDVLNTLERHGALLNGHFMLASGDHSNRFVNKDGIYPHTQDTEEIAGAMAEPFRASVKRVDVVVGPEKGAIILGFLVARALTQALTDLTDEVLAVYAEKDKGGGFTLKRGFDRLVRGKRVLVAENVMTSGGSVAEVIAMLRTLGAEVAGVTAIVNRGGVTAEALGVPKLHALANLDLPRWKPDACPLCQAGTPINTEVGRGKELKKPEGALEL
jgi:orotate phosphoribosyltransferase